MVVVGQVARRIRFRSRSVLARPYICRLSILMRLTVPSTAPELQAWVSPATTASKSLRSPDPRWRAGHTRFPGFGLVGRVRLPTLIHRFRALLIEVNRWIEAEKGCTSRCSDEQLLYCQRLDVCSSVGHPPRRLVVTRHVTSSLWICRF